jgi:hypothetical protein
MSDRDLWGDFAEAFDEDATRDQIAIEGLSLILDDVEWELRDLDNGHRFRSELEATLEKLRSAFAAVLSLSAGKRSDKIAKLKNAAVQTHMAVRQAVSEKFEKAKAPIAAPQQGKAKTPTAKDGGKTPTAAPQQRKEKNLTAKDEDDGTAALKITLADIHATIGQIQAILSTYPDLTAAAVLKKDRDSLQTFRDTLAGTLLPDALKKALADSQTALGNAQNSLKKAKPEIKVRQEAKCGPMLADSAAEETKLFAEAEKEGKLADILKQKIALCLERDPKGPEQQMIDAFPNTAYAKGRDVFDRRLGNAYATMLKRGFPIDTLRPGEVVAAYTYTTADYTNMNRIQLRLPLSDYDPATSLPCNKDKNSLETFNKLTKDAMAKLTNRPGITTRVETIWPGWDQKFVQGKQFTCGAFWSTSITNAAGQWMKSQLTFTVSGKTGKSVADFSDKPKEDEVLYHPDTKFLVTKRVDQYDKDNKEIISSMIEVQEV